MITNIRFLPHVSASLLDQYLAQGWYRIGPFIFSTDHLDHPEGDFPVAWLRYRLDGFEPRKKHHSLIKKTETLQYNFKPLRITEEIEELYTRYRNKLDFFTSESLKRLLYDDLDPEFLDQDIYNSHVIEWRDNGRLIAAGVLDLGNKSSAGIVNFYDPAYKKLSPGKCLMLKKMMLSKEMGMEYYYPGYIAYNYSKFDYKLFLGINRAELFDPEHGLWVNYSEEMLKTIANRYLMKKDV